MAETIILKPIGVVLSPVSERVAEIMKNYF